MKNTREKKDIKERAKKIKIALIAKGLKQTDIAKKLGVSKHTVNKFINRGDQSKRVEQEIQKILEEWGAAL